MATTQKWTAPESIVTVTITINSTANGAQTAASSTIANGTDLYRWAEVELVLGSLTPTGSPYVGVLLIQSLDGTNFEDLSTSALHAMVAALPFTTATGVKRIVSRPFPIPPLDFKLALQNQAGPALASSGNSLKLRRFNEQSV